MDGSIEIRGMRAPDGSVIERLVERFTFVVERAGENENWLIVASRVMFPSDPR